MEVDGEGLDGTPTGEPPGEGTKKPSFKDKVLGTQSNMEQGEFINLVNLGVMKMNYAEGNTSCPMFSLDPRTKAEICKPWEGCLIVKLLGKHIGYGALCEKLRGMWRLTGGYEVRDVSHGYFMVKFDNDADRDKVTSGALWLIYDHYLAESFWARDILIRVQNLMKRDWEVTLAHIPRERNTAADFLARQASREGVAQRCWSQPPSSLIEYILQDNLF